MASVVSRNYIEHALALIVSSEIETNSAAQQARDTLAHWRSTKPEHELAYHEALRQWQLLGNMAPKLKEQFQQPVATHAYKIDQRHLLSIAGALLCVGVLAKAGIWYWYQPIFQQTIHTRVAQIQQVDLPDGTQLDVNARSDLQVTLYRHRREVTITSGEVRFAVSHNADAPFYVHTLEGEVNVIGTIFSVADRGSSVNVTVEEGHVRFQSKLASDSKPGNDRKLARDSSTDAQHASANMPEPVDLYANEFLMVHNGQHGAKMRVDTSDAAAWRDGWLVFNNVRLADAIPQINAFRHSPILLGNHKTAQLRLTGRFLANDSEQLDKALPKILPVQVKQLSGANTLVIAR